MMGALVELDDPRVARYAREHDLSTDDALPRLLDETAAAAERAGRDAVKAGKQKLLHAYADVDRDRPATVTAGAWFVGEGERADLVFDRWIEALAERSTVLRTFLRGQPDVFREWTDEGFQKELEEGWTEEKQEELRQRIEAGPADRDQPARSWWRDWEQAALHPSRTRVFLGVSFAIFGCLFVAPLAHAWWQLLLGVLIGVLVGLALAEHGMRAGRRLRRHRHL
jgi:hypothetical protein